MATSPALLKMTQTEYALVRRLVVQGKALTMADALRQGMMLLLNQHGLTDAERAAIACERVVHRSRPYPLRPRNGEEASVQHSQC